MTLSIYYVSKQLIAVLAISITTVPSTCFRKTWVIMMHGGEMILQIGAARLLATLNLARPS